VDDSRPDQGGRDAAKPDAEGSPRRWRVERRIGVQYAVDPAQHLPDGFGQFRRARRRLHAGGRAHQQLVLEDAPEARQSVAHRWLAQADPVGRPCDVAFAQECVERHQEVQVDRSQVPAHRIPPSPPPEFIWRICAWGKSISQIRSAGGSLPSGNGRDTRESAMNRVEEMKARVKVCMFDQYGTVVDIQGGLTRAATPYLEAKGWKGDPNRFVTWWRRTHFENSMIDALLHREHTPYREIGHMSVAHVLDRAGIAYTMEEVRELVSEIVRLKCFPEVPAALERLRSSYRLVVLSNGDPDMLEEAREHHGMAFDRLISVAEANSFKPHVATYTKAAELEGLEMDEILFVANHPFDVIGAKSAGMRTAFINRRRRPFERTPHQPDLNVGTMTELADVLA
jgi:2-haloacid dehalogenase